MTMRQASGHPRENGADPADGSSQPPGPGGPRGPAGRRKRPRLLLAGLLIALAVAGAVPVAVALTQQQPAPAPGRAHQAPGIPAGVPARLASLMQLSALPRPAAPGFRLTDQAGRTMSLSSFRGKVVVLEFMDSHCTDICPIVSKEFADAHADLGPAAGKVVFAAVNVNQYFRSVHAVAAFSREQGLDTIPGWHFFTGPVPALRAAWHHYYIAVRAPNPKADIIHTSAVYFIDPQGRERFLAQPVAKHRSGNAYLPLSEQAAWGHGIAVLARSLAG